VRRHRAVNPENFEILGGGFFKIPPQSFQYFLVAAAALGPIRDGH
jgi:hypothetical protein